MCFEKIPILEIKFLQRIKPTNPRAFICEASESWLFPHTLSNGIFDFREWRSPLDLEIKITPSFGRGGPDEDLDADIHSFISNLRRAPWLKGPA